MSRPSFQFYVNDWRANAKLRRCSEAERGAWIEVLCVLHKSDEYGVCRWPLLELARAAGVPVRLLKGLASKDVLKGADADSPAYIYTPRHAGMNGEPVVLIEASSGPCWYSSRMVRDEWVGQRRGSSTQFSQERQPSKRPPSGTPDRSPKGGLGERQGDGPSSSSASSTSSSEEHNFSTPPANAGAGARDPDGPDGERGESLTGQNAGVDLTGFVPTPYGAICKAIREAGIGSVSPSNHRLRALVDLGADAAEFVQYVPAALKQGGDPFRYLLGMVEGERRRAAERTAGLQPGRMPARGQIVPAFDAEAHATELLRLAGFDPPGSATGGDVIEMQG